MSSIQLAYHNSFRSVWEYEEAFLKEKIDWKSVIGPYCPICGESCGFRRIADYDREVRELWPPRSGRGLVARFQCRGQRIGATFSMLPHQLIPYHLYTVETILKALLLWWEFTRDSDVSGTAYEVEQSLPEESRVTSWQLRKWLMVIRHGLLSAHSELAGRYDFSSVPSSSRGVEFAFVLETVRAYLEVISRGPPVRFSAVLTALQIYGQITGRMLFGCPSQSRRGAR